MKEILIGFKYALLINKVMYRHIMEVHILKARAEEQSFAPAPRFNSAFPDLRA